MEANLPRSGRRGARDRLHRARHRRSPRGHPGRRPARDRHPRAALHRRGRPGRPRVPAPMAQSAGRRRVSRRQAPVSWPRTVSFVNGRVMADGGTADRVRFARSVIAIGERPGIRVVVVDLLGAFMLPGLVNAHDHLELNHYGRLKFRERYDNATQWIDDMRPRLRDDPGILAGRAHPLPERLFAGALKNVLAGVTMVAHHNPYYRDFRCGVPVRVMRRYGWAHSFAL